jgi:hypothetical protein
MRNKDKQAERNLERGIRDLMAEIDFDRALADWKRVAQEVADQENPNKSSDTKNIMFG